jgi:hypothetical protein
VIHGKLHDSHGPCRTYIRIFIFFVKNYVIHENYVNHEKLADDFLVERNRTDLLFLFLQ